MGFQTEFNWLLVLKGDAVDDFQRYFFEATAGKIDRDEQMVFTKQGARVYPVGHRIGVAFDRPESYVRATARVLEYTVRLEDGAPVTDIHISDIRYTGDYAKAR